jgi:hypothetical protein
LASLHKDKVAEEIPDRNNPGHTPELKASTTS